MKLGIEIRAVSAVFWVTLTAGAGSVAADFDRDAVSQRHVGINVYSGRDRVKVGTGIVLGPETVLSDAQLIGRGQRHTVVLSTGAEFTATAQKNDEYTSLALLKVPGLDAPPVSFAHREVSPEENRFVFAVAVEPNVDQLGATFTFSVGSVSRENEIAGGGAGISLSLYEHNAPLTAAGFGGSLLNNCGELIAVNRPNPNAGGWFSDVLGDPQGVVVATRLTLVKHQLDAWGVGYQESDVECLTEVESAALRASERGEEAEAARQALNEALAREREIAEVAETAKESAATARKAGDEFRAQAEAAQRKADEAAEAERSAQREAEEAAAAVQAAQERLLEAEEAAEVAREAAEAESAQLRDDLQRAEDAKAQLQTRSSRNLIVAIVVGGGLLLLTISLFALRSRRNKRQIAMEQERSEQAASDLEALRRRSDFPDCLFEGTDGQGGNIALKIPGSSLSATVDGVTIGRNPDQAAFVIDSPSVSRVHCRLKYDGDALAISDLNSSNGVVVNGIRLAGEESRLLRPGDRVTLGDVELTLRIL